MSAPPILTEVKGQTQHNLCPPTTLTSPASKHIAQVLCHVSRHIYADLVGQCCHANGEAESPAKLVQFLWTKSLLRDGTVV